MPGFRTATCSTDLVIPGLKWRNDDVFCYYNFRHFICTKGYFKQNLKNQAKHCCCPHFGYSVSISGTPCRRPVHHRASPVSIFAPGAAFMGKKNKQNLKTEQNCCCPHCRMSPSRVYSVHPAHHRTIWCRSTFGPRGPGLSNPTFLRPALPMAPTTDNNARDERSVLRPNPATFFRDVTLYIMTTKYAIIRKRCLNYTACLTVIRREFPFGNMVKKRFAKKIAAGKRLIPGWTSTAILKLKPGVSDVWNGPNYPILIKWPFLPSCHSIRWSESCSSLTSSGSRC